MNSPRTDSPFLGTITAADMEASARLAAVRAEQARTAFHEALVAAGASHEAVTEVLDAMTAAGYRFRRATGYGRLIGPEGDADSVLAYSYALFGQVNPDAHHYAALSVTEPWRRVAEHDLDAGL